MSRYGIRLLIAITFILYAPGWAIWGAGRGLALLWRRFAELWGDA